MEDDVAHMILEEVRNTRAELHLHRAESSDRHDALDTRVRGVEGWQNNVDGKVTMFGIFCTIAGGLIAWLSNFVKHQ